MDHRERLRLLQAQPNSIPDYSYHTIYGTVAGANSQGFRYLVLWSSTEWTYSFLWASLVTQMVKDLPAMWENLVWSLGQEDPLEKEMATHSSIVAWRISWTKEPGRLQFKGSQRFRHDWVTSLSLSLRWEALIHKQLWSPDPLASFIWCLTQMTPAAFIWKYYHVPSFYL